MHTGQAKEILRLRCAPLRMTVQLTTDPEVTHDVMLNIASLQKKTFAMSILKRLALCPLFASLLLIPSFAQHFLGAFSGLTLQVDTQIESPVQNNNVQTLPEQEAGDTIQFQLFVPAGTDQSTNGYTVELDLPGKTFSSYIGNVSGTDWTGGALISTGSTKLSALFPTGDSVPSTGYLGQLDLQVTRSLEGGATLIVKNLSITSGSDVDVLDVSNAIITFTAPATGSGDFDGNGNVNIADFLAFVDVFGKSSSDAGFDARMDFDGNGNIDIADFLAFVDVFGTTYSTGGGQGGGGQGGGGQGGGDSSVIPPPPGNVKYQWDSSTSQYQISWDPSPNATSYQVYYDHADLLDPSCPGGCDLIGTVTGTSFGHFRHSYSIGYWVRACNDTGCSNYVRASKNGGDSSVIPPPPGNVKYQWDSSTSQYQISWDPSPNATSYRVYYDNATAYSVSCPGGCDLIGTVSDTSVGHFRHREGELAGFLNSYRRKIGYWVRACNDAGCSNYVRASRVRTSRGDDIGPDLIVESASVSNGSPNEGQSFTLSVTVRNQGNRQSAATMLRYYRSLNSGISRNDTEVGTDAVSSLSTSGATSKSVDLTASSSYYYGACVDAVNNENNISNNCSSSVPVIVGGQPLSTITVIELDASIHSPTGITYANDRFYVVDSFRNKVYAYMSSGQRDAASDFDLSPDNELPAGITYANDRFYVIERLEDKVYAYMSSGQRDAASNFDLSPDNGWPTGITYANDRFYVVDRSDDKVYAYMSSGQRDAASDFDLNLSGILHPTGIPTGITYANDRFYVVDDSFFGSKVYAYMSSGQRDAASDFALSSGNNRPAGITYGNDRFYVVDDKVVGVDRVYVVNP